MSCPAFLRTAEWVVVSNGQSREYDSPTVDAVQVPDSSDDIDELESEILEAVHDDIDDEDETEEEEVDDDVED